MSDLIDFTIGLNKRLPELFVTFEDDNGAVLISGATAVTITMQRVSDGTLKLNAVAATNLDDGAAANKGKAKYSWATGDTDTAGIYKVWFTATIGGKGLEAPKRPVQPFLLVLVI